MKKIITALVILFSDTAFTQSDNLSEQKFFNKDDWEISFAANIGKSTKNNKYNYVYGYETINTESGEFTEGNIYSQLGISVGYFVIDNLSIEPQLDINFFADGISSSILGNLCYTFEIPQNIIFPYLRIGYGISNFSDNDGIFDSMNYKTIAVSAGLKFMYYPGTTFKTDLNYKHLSGTNEYYYVDPVSFYSTKSTQDITVSAITFTLGLTFQL